MCLPSLCGTLESEGGALRLHRKSRRARRRRPTQDFPVTIVAGEEIGQGTRTRAVEKVVHVAGFAPRPVLSARIVLRENQDPAVERPAVVKVELDVGGRPVRAHVAGKRMEDAIDLLEERLRRSLEDLGEIARARRHEAGIAGPGEWRHGSLPTARPEYYPRPADERELIRHKTFALSPLVPEEAVLEMQALDHDFYLFTNADTGEENVVSRRADGRIVLNEVTPGADERALPLAVDPLPPPVMLLAGAIERLNASGEPFLFFVDGQTRAGNVLYRRYDGHYGLIEPAEPEGAETG